MEIDTEELMKEVRRIRILTRRLLDERLSGDYHSKASSSMRPAPTSPATTSAPSIGTSPPARANPTSSASARNAS